MIVSKISTLFLRHDISFDLPQVSKSGNLEPSRISKMAKIMCPNFVKIMGYSQLFVVACLKRQELTDIISR